MALLRAASEQPLDLRPETLEQRALGLYLRLQTTALETPAGTDGDTASVSRSSPARPRSRSRAAWRKEGFISDAGLFRNYMRYHGIDQRLAAGDFEIAKNMTMPEIAERLQRARYEEIVLTIPEGMRAEEVADLLDVKGVMDGQAFLALVRGGSASAEALGDYPWLPAGLDHAGRLSVPRHLSAACPCDAGGSHSPYAGQLPESRHGRDPGAGQTGRTQRGAGHQYGLHRRARSDLRRRAPTGRQRLLEPRLRRVQQGDRRQLPAGRSDRPVRGRPARRVVVETAFGGGVPDHPIALQHLPAARPAADGHRQPRPLGHRGRGQPGRHQVLLLRGVGDGSHVFATTLAEHQANVARYQK